MPEINRRLRLRACRHIYNNFRSNEFIELEDYFNEEVPSSFFGIHDELEIDDDDFLDYCIDNKDIFYQDIEHIIDEETHLTEIESRIEIKEEIGLYFIKSTTFGLEINNDELMRYMAILESFHGLSTVEKGTRYERFTGKYLEDIGIKSTVTEQSNDKGIDVAGYHSLKLESPEISKLFKRSEILFLVQSKFTTEVTYEPVLRHLIGDSIFIQQESKEYEIEDKFLRINYGPTQLIVVSHKGFSQGALQFGKIKGIVCLNSKQIISILTRCENSRALEYLDSFTES
ncbi:MAG: restriction endonuclease [Candidatus Peribacteraceae bacterium]|nr:restriction endonuclease [Candidatus Peribacteraceae bacterium]